MHAEELKPNITVHGPLFPEPVQVIVAIPMGASVKLVGKGTRSNSVYEPILTAEQLALLTASPAHEPFDGDARKFRLGIEAMRLGLAYEYDPYFSLSIARVDPLPHQLEAVPIDRDSARRGHPRLDHRHWWGEQRFSSILVGWVCLACRFALLDFCCDTGVRENDCVCLRDGTVSGLRFSASRPAASQGEKGERQGEVVTPESRKGEAGWN
ncbi:MAG: hypothetical protein LC136_06630 [Burkholderiales bacterium]|nr:hypothetical protein [Burkholderiaceae bacterium]MCZ2413920.1 hypothetical protein [Burkholderiales bacterium]MDL1907177.1 hypothetical protein [Betaproteobacteria bacterium PRO1]